MTEPATPNTKPLAYRLARALGSVWIGVALLLLLALYLGFVSVFIRTAMHWLGTSELGVYSHPIPVTLTLAAVANLVFSTLTRVRFGWEGLGALVTHAGLLVFAVGCAIYVAGREEGIAVSGWRVAGTPWTPVREFFLKDTHAVSLAVLDGQPATRPATAPARASTSQPAWPAEAVTVLDIRPPVQVKPKDVADLWLQKTFGVLQHNQAEPVPVNVPLTGAPAGVSVRAKAYYPFSTFVRGQWTNDWPEPAPAVDLAVTDPLVGDRPTYVVICARPGHRTLFRQCRGRDYVVYYNPRIDAQQARAYLRRLITEPGRDGPLVPVLLTGRTAPLACEVLTADGVAYRTRLEVNRNVPIPIGGRRIWLGLFRTLTHASDQYELGPLTERPEHGAQRAVPVLEVEVRAGDVHRTVFLPFDEYRVNRDPTFVPLPDGRRLALHFSARAKPLPRQVQIERVEHQTQPGTRIPKDFISDLTLSAPDGTGPPEQTTLRLNDPVQIGPYQLHQADWSFHWPCYVSEHEPSCIFLGVGSRPGLLVIWVGCWLICLGFPYAFYVKPLLRRRRRART